MTKTATISLHGNRYEVDAALVGRRVEVVFDPFDLATLRSATRAGRWESRSRTGSAATSTPTPAPTSQRRRPPPTGIDYLALVAAQHRAELAARINYTDLPTSRTRRAATAIGNGIDQGLEAELASFAALRHQLADGELPGQLDLTELTDEPPTTRLPAARTGSDDHRESAAHYGFTRMPFGEPWPRRCCTGITPTAKPSPGSAGA